MQPLVYIFIGPPSSGKSYLGKRFAVYKKYPFYEADDDYLPEYRKRTRISTEEKDLVYEEFYNVVIHKIQDLLSSSNLPVVVASAIGKEKNRKRFVEIWGDRVIFVYIRSPREELIDNAINEEFPKLQGVSKLTQEIAESVTEHLIKKYDSYEIPQNAVVVDNDYTEESFNKMIDILNKYS